MYDRLSQLGSGDNAALTGSNWRCDGVSTLLISLLGGRQPGDAVLARIFSDLGVRWGLARCIAALTPRNAAVHIPWALAPSSEGHGARRCGSVFSPAAHPARPRNRLNAKKHQTAVRCPLLPITELNPSAAV